ncbi:MAG: hypothetical protein AAGF79_09180 [Pseudomonadota bacterium]
MKHLPLNDLSDATSAGMAGVATCGAEGLAPASGAVRMSIDAKASPDRIALVSGVAGKTADRERRLDLMRLPENGAEPGIAGRARTWVTGTRGKPVPDACAFRGLRKPERNRT